MKIHEILHLYQWGKHTKRMLFHKNALLLLEKKEG